MTPAPDFQPPPSGRIWRFGENVDTDAMAPGRFMKDGLDVLASHCLENLRPEFPGAVKPGDVIVAGSNFGMGSSREQAAQALKHLGVSAVLASSFAGLFYRNAINIGLPVLVCADTAALADGARATFFLDAAEIRLCDGRRVSCEPVPDFLRALLHAGGLVPHLKARLNKV
ncbi:MAG: 3-isopropylmalate dehydratase [Burkholderiaceae bacterium]|jgi:3-isopropylmalate/(R)-2-methylmalate dehydratase small subunit|uniref:3-isopropylmalate dehydratase small subunit n=1 Tax=Cupriavidus metallidurans TaxID=119219 RepID=A0A482IZ71_9BURK|nr:MULTISPECIES: 3-isopropylmalate dehydratase [Cupriavidus]KWR76820.1 3-isopropylmalate dehydratase [Cupriavidus sp. SHE]PCH54837.1 MAG: 3-isopropylmalate dehydratase [Burkholderiaceae bacterium]QBP13721.1 3-isopropylmalate dehydratase [Cupriavidus metallidurans]QWC91497.1 3-isopropylmalate dehydratase [Cupriavidus metallidurans]